MPGIKVRMEHNEKQIKSGEVTPIEVMETREQREEVQHLTDTKGEGVTGNRK